MCPETPDERSSSEAVEPKPNKILPSDQEHKEQNSNMDHENEIPPASPTLKQASSSSLQQPFLQLDNSCAKKENNSMCPDEQSSSNAEDTAGCTGTREIHVVGIMYCKNAQNVGSESSYHDCECVPHESDAFSSKRHSYLNTQSMSSCNQPATCETMNSPENVEYSEPGTESHERSHDSKISPDHPCNSKMSPDHPCDSKASPDGPCDLSKASSDCTEAIKQSPSFSLLHRSQRIPVSKSRVAPVMPNCKLFGDAIDDASETERSGGENKDRESNSGLCAMDLSRSSEEPLLSGTNKQQSLPQQKRSQVNVEDWVEVDSLMETCDARPVAIYTDTGAPVMSQATHDGSSDTGEGIGKMKFGISDKARAGTSMNIDGDDKPYRCPICLKTFNHLKLHMKVHIGDRPYKCTVCSKAYIEARHLENHMRSHTGEKPFKCDLCDKSFSRDTHLTYHRRTHTGEKPYSCEICEKRFSRKGDLVVHIRIHTGEKPFPCSLCDKSCATQSNLTLHLRTHTGEKPYNCEICPKKFKSKSDLIKHTRSHEGMKPFECELCHKKFRSSGDLTRHHRSHTGEKPYKCDVCLKEFSSDYYLPRHACKGSKSEESGVKV